MANQKFIGFRLLVCFEDFYDFSIKLSMSMEGDTFLFILSIENIFYMFQGMFSFSFELLVSRVNSPDYFLTQFKGDLTKMYPPYITLLVNQEQEMSQFLIEDQMAPSPDAKHVYQLFNSNQKVLKYNQSLPDFSFDHASPELRKPLNKLNIDIQVNEYGQEPSNLAQKLKIPLQKIELSRSNFKTQEKNEMLQKPTQGQCYPGTSIVEQINSYRMGSESTNITSRTAINQSKSMNIHTTPNVTKNPKFCLNLGFSNNSKAGGVNYLSSFDQGQDSFRTTRQQVLMGQLSKRSQLCTMNHKSLLSNAKQQQNQNSTHQNNSISISHLINGVNNQTTYQNRLHEFLMKSNEKCSSNLRNCNRTGNNKATKPQKSKYFKEICEIIWQ